jgi:hypothetical protein
MVGIAWIGRVEPVDNFWLWGGLKLGAGYNFLEADSVYQSTYFGTTETTEETIDFALAYSVEGGIRYQFKRGDIGFIIKYTKMNQKIEGVKDSELGGTAFLITVGFNI